MSWGFLWIMVALKIPLIALIYLVWWAIKQEPEEETPQSNDDDGGLKRYRRHPREPFPRHPRRGPHGDRRPQPPKRSRTVRAKARTLGH